MTWMPPTSYAVQTESTSPKLASAFAAGCNGPVTAADTLQPGPIALFGSPQRVDLLRQAQREGRDWYYADHGFYRRGKYYRIARNRYQPLVDSQAVIRAYAERVARSYPQPISPPARFQELRIDVAPAWTTTGSAIIICPNSPAYMSWFGVDADEWVIGVVRALSKYTDRPIVIRWKTNKARRPLYLDLHDAWAVIVFSSASAIEALCAGVPIFTLVDWATTHPMGLDDLSKIEDPYRPDHREPWLWSLANRQWTLEEIRRGDAWRFFANQPQESL